MIDHLAPVRPSRRVSNRILRTGIALVLALSATASIAETVAGPQRALTSPRSLQSPRSADAKPVSVDDLFTTARSESAVWSVDGKSIIFNSDREGRMNIWSRPVDGGLPRKLSDSGMREGGVEAAPDGRTILFAGDKDGRQIFDLYSLSVGGGDAVNLTATDDISETAGLPSADGRFVAFARRPAKSPSYDIAVLDLASREVRSLTKETTEGVQWMPVAVSPDNRYILANRFDWSLTVGELYLVDVATGEATRLTPPGRYARAGDISPDGRLVSASLENEAGVRQAIIIDVTARKTIALPQSEWEQTAGRFSPDGRSLIVTTNADGRDIVSLHDVASRQSRTLRLPGGVSSSQGYTTGLPRFSPDGRRLLFAHTSGSDPMDYWIYDLEANRSRRVTDLGGALSGLPRTQIIRYPGSDGTVISAVLWMPYNLKRDRTHPAVVIAHGGPTGQATDAFDRTAAALASRGYIVMAPNFRGSTGYGRDFRDANRMDLGGGDLADVVAGADFLIRTGYVDPKRVGITGGSYGGAMTMMAIAKTPMRWAAAVELFGIVNWRTMWEQGAPQNRRYQEGLIGDPAKNPEVYDRASPLTYLHQVRAPLLVLHGENDPLVPAIEARQVVDVLRRQGSAVDAHFYPGEGHGFAKRENQIDVLERTIAWFDRHMGRK
ncbi:S9 family peptidase [Sphingopyxis sp. 22461]|uniref:S9 family peptidase n=1 Tax=Sphingopyxis sp. 22461 TaxID=3453923 RepID=UPI003F86FC3B